MKVLKFLIIASLTASVACSKESNEISGIPADTLSVMLQDSIQTSDFTKDTLLLETFAIPPEVEGCSCYFAKDEQEFERQQFIYADDYGSSAYLKLDGKLVKIPMNEGDFDPSNFKKTIENAQYRVTMSGKQLSAQEELMIFEGQLTVENKSSGEKVTTPIFGECGC
ncbi:hypothetical protein CO230_04545 [Chryseobacterium sp. 6424]|uniref:hypothetical protein n=1 Tax=Chryseobacterium sp. 6424 TaxID=2039166 RepID=UPI000EFD9D60|nr:hypothetical protein [Chryseobacterium sp. 6424]AYO57453.1 hypothetical protein CO230_04545 [Chryseobacterium sp. 6424]